MKENKITCFVCGAKLTEETEYSFDGKHMCQHCLMSGQWFVTTVGKEYGAKTRVVMMLILFALIAMKTVTQTVRTVAD